MRVSATATPSAHRAPSSPWYRCIPPQPHMQICVIAACQQLHSLAHPRDQRAAFTATWPWRSSRRCWARSCSRLGPGLQSPLPTSPRLPRCLPPLPPLVAPRSLWRTCGRCRRPGTSTAPPAPAGGGRRSSGSQVRGPRSAAHADHLLAREGEAYRGHHGLHQPLRPGEATAGQLNAGEQCAAPTVRDGAV